ncbi:MAG: molecular chaperone HtpG [Chlamydiales bacterium]|jgi:molecular chaperone HtpG
MSTGTLKIHSENILPIIKQWLYSDKDIFVRELVSNACDAIQKTKVLRDLGDVEALDEDFRIEIKVNEEEKTLTFIDNGIGMNAEEVEKYIAELAFSGAEDFVKKYTSEDEKDQIIGHFGLGFYSTYMVADKVEINTLSYKADADPALWSCDGTAEYDLSKGSRENRGTEITLHVMDDEKEFLDVSKLTEILTRYCSFLPYPIYLNDTHINKAEPLWVKSPADCTDEDYLNFYHQLYPMEADPLFWVHLNVDFPFHLKGILYFPKIRNNYDFSKNNMRLFCNRVFVSDDCRDLVPDFLTMLQGAIDSPDIPLNVSRSTLQMDRNVRQMGTHISKKISDRLSNVYKADREKFITFWEDIEVIVKLGAMQDEKFYSRVKELLLWKNAQSEWTNIEDYLERNKEKHENVAYYSIEENRTSNFLELYKQQGIEVLCTASSVDVHLISFLESKLQPAKFKRIDSSTDDVILDKSKEKTLLDTEGKTEAIKLAEFVKTKLDLKNVEVEAKSLASDSVPGFVMFDENARRMRDYLASSNGQLDIVDDTIMGKRTFVVNTNNSLINSLEELNKQDSDLAKELVQHVYQLSLLSQKEMPAQTLNEFITRSSDVIQKLTDIATKKKES